MEAFRLHLKIKSDTLKIPELKKFIGRHMELILIEEPAPDNISKGIPQKLQKLRGKISFDDHALSSLREESKI